MNRRTISRIAVLAAASLFLTACPKKPNTPPVSDTELQSAIDVAWATYAITDLQMMCAFVGVNEFQDHFYRHVNNTPVINQSKATRDISERRISMNFNETPCMDGRKRRGEVRLYYNPVPLNPDQHYVEYYHEFGFQGKLNLIDYRVDGWLVTVDEGARIKNQLTSYTLVPRSQNLEWSLEGRFSFTHPNDPSRNMTLDCKLVQELLNTSDNRVFSLSGQPAISWSLAANGYHGSVTGVVLGNIPFKMTIEKKAKLVRDFTCSPDLLGVSAAGSDLLPVNEEHHPFTKGVAIFEPEGKYPRLIYFGSDAGPDQAAQCDNSGQVKIKGLLYSVNFQK